MCFFVPSAICPFLPRSSVKRPLAVRAKAVAGSYCSPPHGTPKQIIDKLTAAVNALTDPAVREKVAAEGLEIPPRERPTPEAVVANVCRGEFLTQLQHGRSSSGRSRTRADSDVPSQAQLARLSSLHAHRRD
jgi:hypothetical protein